jgi:DNA-binding FadR family transcriptional regulator
MIKNVHGNTVDHLGEAIVAGRYAAGASVPPEPALCEELGVSRTVVREAVKSLIAKGLITTGPKVGTRVLPSEELELVRPDVVMAEQGRPHARVPARPAGPAPRGRAGRVRMAAERATPPTSPTSSAAFAGMRRAVEEGGDYVTYDLRFHQGLLKRLRTTACWCR